MTLYAPKDVAGIVGVTVVTLCHWRKRNIGPDWSKHGSLVYYPAGDLRDYIERVGPIPANMTAREKKTFFTAAHKAPNPEPAPEPMAPKPATEPATMADLAARVTALERALVRLRAGKPKRRQVVKRKRVKGRRKVRVRVAGAPRVPKPTPDAIPY